MDSEERARLNELMARLAAGDDDAVFALHARFGDRLAAKMLGHVRALNARQPDRDELHGLVLDGWFALRECATGWDPDGGALPWNWAGHRLRQVAVAWVGQYADEFDEALLVQVPAPTLALVDDEDDQLVVLERLAQRHDEVRLFREALLEVASPRDCVVLLEVRVQHQLGDPSPAATVALMMDMSPGAVRKVHSRVRSRLRALAAEDRRYAAVSSFALAA